MGNKFSSAVIFMAGAAVGSLVTWRVLKAKYEKLTEEEIESVKEAFSKKIPVVKTEETKPNDLADKATHKPDIMTYANALKKQGYVDYSGSQDTDEVEEDDDDEFGPVVISPDQFGEDNGFSKISFTYYADGVLADDVDEEIDDIDSMIGLDSLDHFGEYEEDALYVRDSEKHCDYEILKDLRTYADVVGEKPYLRRQTEE